MKSDTHDVVVIGSGIIGVTIAWELSKAGREVLLMDHNEPGMGCSYGNAAHFATEQIFPIANRENLKNLPRYLMSSDSPLTFKKSSLHRLIPWGLRYLMATRESVFHKGTAALNALNKQSLPAWRELLTEIGALDMLHSPGTLQLAESRKGAAELANLHQELKAYDVPSTLLDTREVMKLLENLPAGDYTGLYFPDTAYCDDPHAFLLEVFKACLNREVSFVRQNAQHVASDGMGGLSVITDTSTVRAKSVVIACGVHSKTLVEPLGYRVPMIAERGYHLLLPAAGTELPLPITLHERQFIMTPMAGSVRLAGTVEFAGVDDPPTMKRANMLFDQARYLFPDLNDDGATQWMGNRPTMPDYLPVIDHLDRVGQVFVSYGHAHLGLTQAAISARLLTDMMLGNASSIDHRAYRIDR